MTNFTLNNVETTALFNTINRDDDYDDGQNEYDDEIVEEDDYEYEVENPDSNEPEEDCA